MEIKINFTIIIQIFNFLISYFLLRKFFFRFAIDTLNKRESELKFMQNKIFNLEKKVVQKNLEKLENWQQARLKFNRYILGCSLDAFYKKLKIKPIAEKALSKDNENYIISNIGNMLVKTMEKC